MEHHISKLPKYYDEAVMNLTNLEGKISNDQYLEIYGLFMQTFFGDMFTSSRPNSQIEKEVMFLLYSV